MTLDDDWLPFRDAVIATAALAHRRLSEDVAARYFYALDDLEWPAIRGALERFARSVEAGQTFPTPVELRRRATLRVATRPTPPDSAPAEADHALTRRTAAAILRGAATRAAPGLARAFEAQARLIETGGGSVGTVLEAAAAGVLAPPAVAEEDTPPQWWDR
jgi:hypothetical protein